eukprot:m.691086 g.691086  ORF g.691086 m.691086 type:complete len:55 (+) comp58638_c0_seq66:232-396(+)
MTQSDQRQHVCCAHTHAHTQPSTRPLRNRISISLLFFSLTHYVLVVIDFFSVVF